MNESLSDFLRAGNEGFWLERGIAARWDAIGRAEWLGGGVRLLILFGLVHALARVLGAHPRIALGAGAAVAIVWSIAGPAIADGSTPYPFDGSALGIVAWLLLVSAMVAAVFFADSDPVGRRVYGGLLLWAAPTSLLWAYQRADQVRHLAPALAPLVLLAAAALTSVSLALARLRQLAVLAPAVVVALLVLANVPSIDVLDATAGGDSSTLGLPAGATEPRSRTTPTAPFRTNSIWLART
jgi:hypothetical protein